MSKTDFDRIATYYNHLVDQYGHDPRACDASSRVSLELRYKVLADVCNLDGMSVLEIGCGFGDLGAYLHAKHPDVRYTGIDISPRMIEAARRVYPESEFRCGNALEVSDVERFDVVMAQGIFYLLQDDPEAQTQALIAKMYSIAEKAVAFCAISSWSPRKTEGEFYLNPNRALDWCATLTRRVVMRHEYLDNDVAFYLYKK